MIIKPCQTFFPRFLGILIGSVVDTEKDLLFVISGSHTFRISDHGVTLNAVFLALSMDEYFLSIGLFTASLKDIPFLTRTYTVCV